MTTYITMPLFAEASYSYIISLENQSYIFQAYFNERAKSWFFNLLLEDKTYLVAGERLIPNFPLLIDYSIEGLTGFIFLWPKTKTNVENYKENARNLYNDYDMFYIYET